jgi:tetratricopeptide (TPR) repeat protein
MPVFDRFFGRKNDEQRGDSAPPANTAPVGPAETGDPAGKALIAFLNAPSLEEKHAILQRDQQLLLTDTVIGLVQVAMRTQQTVGNPELARQYQQDGALLLMAREQGIPAAWSSYQAAAIAAQLDSNPLFPVVDEWLATPSYRAERHYLETHLELLEPGSDEVLTALAARFQTDAGHARDLREHLALLQDIRARGHDVQSVRDGYVNAMGGFRLDLPPWVEELEEHDAKLRQQGAGGVAPRVTMLRQAAERAGADASLAPEIAAEIYLRLWTALSEVAGPDRPGSQEEGLVALADAYLSSTDGDTGENIERAIAAYQSALQVWTRDRAPVAWAKIHYNLGDVYARRSRGTRLENQQKAIAAYSAALEVFTRATHPLEFAAAKNNLGTVYLMPGTGTVAQNADKAIAAFDAAMEVYTADQYPQDHAQTQRNRDHAVSMRDGLRGLGL